MTLFLQALINGLMTGTLIAVPAIGFSAIFAVLRYPNFAIASYATIGAFAAWWANAILGLPVIPAIARGLHHYRLHRRRRRGDGAEAAAWQRRADRGDRLDRAQSRAREHRPLHLRQRHEGLRPAAAARHPLRRPAHRPAAAAEPGARRRDHGRDVPVPALHPLRQGHARRRRQSRSRPAEGHRPRPHRRSSRCFWVPA